MQSDAAGDPVSLQAALEVQADRLGLGILLAEPGGRLLFASTRAMRLLGCEHDRAGLDRLWQSLAREALREASPDRPSPFTLDVPNGAAARRLRGQQRALAPDLVEILLSDPRQLSALDIELLCAARMREWLHQSEAIVHDANGALNTIQLTLELLDGQWPGQQAGAQAREPHRRNHVGVIRDNLDRLKTCLRQLVAVHEDARSSDYDLRDVVKEAAATLRMPARRRRIELGVRAMEQPLPARGNPARIRQALVNAALARIDALGERGRLEISGATDAAGRVTLVCADSGALSAEARAGIWMLLGATPPDASVRDGLRLARAIVESEGGELGIEQDGGTRVLFLMPGVAA